MSQISGYTLNVDLLENRVNSDDGLVFGFEVEEFRRFCLLNGLDDIGLTMQQKDKIRRCRRDSPRNDSPLSAAFHQCANLP